MTIDIEEAAQRLTRDLFEYHEELIARNTDARDAVLVKSIALIALAFDVPPTSDGEFDIDEIMEKLRDALETLVECKERQ